MNEISLDELIGNLQTYELRKSAQVKEESKKDRGIALKALESDNSEMDDEELAMFTRRFKKMFKRSNFKKGSSSKTKKADRDQIGCFRCGKHDHIVKNCPLPKEEQPTEQVRGYRKNFRTMLGENLQRQ